MAVVYMDVEVEAENEELANDTAFNSAWEKKDNPEKWSVAHIEHESIEVAE